MSDSPIDRVRAWLRNTSATRAAIIAPYVKDGQTYFLTTEDLSYLVKMADATGAEKRYNELLKCLGISQKKLSEAVQAKNRLADTVEALQKEIEGEE